MFDGRVVKYGLVSLMIASAAALFINWLGDDYEIAQRAAEPIHQPPPEPEPVALESRLLFGGDVYWGRLFEREAPDDYAFPFSGLNTLNREDYDAWIANVECPITDEIVSFEAQWNAIQFNCLPEYLPEAAKWFDVVSLANNHTNNVRGQEGLDETRANLEAHNIQHFGHYEPGVLEDICEVVAVDARLVLDDGSEEAVPLPIALCGYHSVFRQLTQEEIDHLSTYAEHFITIALPHAGAEYQPSADAIRQTAFRGMIDAGADAVFGGHPHWVQNAEVYNDKLIVYSMGNFIFDQQFSAEVTRSALVDMTITLAHDSNLEQYLTVAEGCDTHKDACLEAIVQSGANKPEAAFSYDIVATKTTDLVTALADEATEASILERLQWDTIQSQLDVTSVTEEEQP